MIMYAAFIYVLFCALTTALASAAHGQGWTDKGLGGKLTVVLLHLLAAPLVAPFFWLIFRRHKQADAELDLFGDDVGNYEAVRKAYYIWPLNVIMSGLMRNCMEKPWAFLGPIPTRIQQELYHGVVGAFLGLATLPILLVIVRIIS